MFPAIVAVTVHVPALDDVKAPEDSEQSDALSLATEYETKPPVVPPDVVNVMSVPYVPDVDVSDKAAWFALVTVTVPFAGVNE